MSTLTATSRIPAILAPPLAALQFLTRIPIPAIPYDEETLPRATAFFPLVGAFLGSLGALAYHILSAHLTSAVAAIVTVTLLVLLTGALHEDALADCADAFGLPRTRERTLAILHDSAIGSFGACALALSLFARAALIAALPAGRMTPILIAAMTLSRWSILPLTLLKPASPGGRGSGIAGSVSRLSLTFGSILAGGVVLCTLHTAAWVPALASLLVVAGSAAFYKRRLGGITGDCFGATVQLVELTVLLCGAWHP